MDIDDEITMGIIEQAVRSSLAFAASTRSTMSSLTASNSTTTEVGVGNLTTLQDEEEEQLEFAESSYNKHNLTTIVSLSLIYGLLSLTACVGNLIVIWIIGNIVFTKYLLSIKWCIVRLFLTTRRKTQVPKKLSVPKKLRSNFRKTQVSGFSQVAFSQAENSEKTQTF